MKFAATSGTFGSSEAACLGKQPFETYDAAARIVRRRRGRIKVKDGTLQIYRCCYCHNWHMGGGTGKSRV
jgi:hypothetical protein